MFDFDNDNDFDLDDIIQADITYGAFSEGECPNCGRYIKSQNIKKCPFCGCNLEMFY